MLTWRRFLILVPFALGLAFVPEARAARKPAMPEPEPFGRFTVDQVERRLGQPNVHVFDGNRRETYVENHLPGAVQLHSKDIKAELLPEDKDAILIFYCMNEL